MGIVDKARIDLDGLMRSVLSSLNLSLPSIKSKEHFPDGLRWHYYSSYRGKRKWRFCWSLTRNDNGKFVSWVYMPRGGRIVKRRLVEHRLKKAAKRRAGKLQEQFEATNPDPARWAGGPKEIEMTTKVGGGTVTEKIVKESATQKALKKLMVTKANGKAKAGNSTKVSTNGKEKRAAFIERYGKVIAATWAGLTGKSKGPAGVQKKLPELNTWQIDYALVKLGLKKSTCKAMLQWIRDDEAKAPVVKANGKAVAEKAASKPKSKALIAREKREAESVERFNASSLPSEVVCAGLK